MDKNAISCGMKKNTEFHTEVYTNKLPNVADLPRFKYLIFYFNQKIRAARAPKKMLDMEVFSFVEISSRTYYTLLGAPIISEKSTSIDILLKFAQFYSQQLGYRIKVDDLIHPAAKTHTQTRQKP